MIPQNRIRAVSDLINLQLPSQLAPGVSWGVVAIEPEKDSGKGLADGPYIDGETGKLVIPPGGKFVVRYAGKCTVMTALLGEVAQGASWTYEAKVEMGGEQSPPLSSSNYSPITGGGALLCEIKNAGNGLERFGKVYSIPDGWTNDVAEGFKQYVTGDPEHPVELRLGRNLKEVTAVFRGKNRFGSFLAARRLHQTQILAQVLSPTDLIRGDAVLSAAIVQMFIKDPKAAAWKAFLPILNEAVSNIQNFDECEGLVLGLIASRVRTSDENARSRNAETSGLVVAQIEKLVPEGQRAGRVASTIELLKTGGAPASRRSEQK
ncbi:MAG: hypothetical protein HY286_07850 [Planctomycetes bacterium]|nr:hypothetical protein [Planctomycetota bacterium]